MLYERSTAQPIGVVGRKVEEATKRHGFGVIAVHNLQEKMREKGVDFAIPVQIYEVCNPHQAKVVLEADPSISTALPCRIALFQKGDRTTVATIRPTAQLAGFNRPDLEPVACEVEGVILKIIDDATGA